MALLLDEVSPASRGGYGEGLLKIGLYIEHGEGNGVGGAELMMAFAAATWAKKHDVDLIHHRPTLTRERLQAFTSTELTGFSIRPVVREPEPEASRNLVRRYRDAREWHRALSEPYDLFVACTHWVPPFSFARRSALLVLFPFYIRPGYEAGPTTVPVWKRMAHRAYYDLEWHRRMGTYDLKISISEFARHWTSRRWGIETKVIPPPVDVGATTERKNDLILSVGRFSTMAHTKKQLDMMRAFAEMRERAEISWTYASVGGLNARRENHDYFERVRSLGERCGALVEANLGRAELKALLGRATIFWHATGFGEDTDARPELAEHFGISVVEAMAAGCVPVVVNKGGPAEIVEHGKSGFVWSTIRELQYFTRLLTCDRGLSTDMAAAARARADLFSQQRFATRLSTACRIAI
jgi:glycosyltransferase involved in cell wall biosynthesis